MSPKEHRVPVAPEELALSTAITNEALLRVLVRKGLVTEQEVLDEVRAVRQEMAGRRRGGTG